MNTPEPQHSDNSEAIALNNALIEQLKNQGVLKSPHVEDAFRSVLRHYFLPGVPLQEVYADKAISAKQNEKGQWISSSSQPAIMAIMLEQLDLQPGHKVLEIGTGPGYNAALMAHIAGETGQVVTVEIDQDLTDAAREHLNATGFAQVQAVCADGGYGYPDAAPYDRIILTVGAPDITPNWWNQLKPYGRIVLPLVLRGSMKSIAFEKGEDQLTSLSVTDCGFIALRGDFAVEHSGHIQVGPDPNLYIEPMNDFPIDGQAVYELLTGASKDWTTDVEVNLWDVFGGSLWTWLALHEPHICKLTAEGHLAEKNIVPPLVGVDGKQKLSSTAILPDGSGLAALIRPPDEVFSLIPFDKLTGSEGLGNTSFPLFVRQFGSDESVAQRLLAQIQSWKAAGAPSSNTMQIRAYPTGSRYTPKKDEIVLQKQWTTLVIEWPASA